MTYGIDLKKGGKFRFHANKEKTSSDEWIYVDEHTIRLRYAKSGNEEKLNYDGDLQIKGSSRVFRKVS